MRPVTLSIAQHADYELTGIGRSLPEPVEVQNGISSSKSAPVASVRCVFVKGCYLPRASWPFRDPFRDERRKRCHIGLAGDEMLICGRNQLAIELRVANGGAWCVFACSNVLHEGVPALASRYDYEAKR